MKLRIDKKLTIDETVVRRYYGNFTAIYLHGRLKHVYYTARSRHEGMVINILYPKVKKKWYQIWK